MKKELCDKVTRILDEENSAYILYNNKIIERISEVELNAIESAFINSADIVAEHIHKAFNFYSDRNNPDYENSIKESSLALEAFFRNVTDTDAQLSTILSTHLEKIKHLALRKTVDELKKVITKLYAYAGDAPGARHALKNNNDHIKKEEAFFILTTSSALINYLNSLNS